MRRFHASGIALALVLAIVAGEKACNADNPFVNNDEGLDPGHKNFWVITRAENSPIPGMGDNIALVLRIEDAGAPDHIRVRVVGYNDTKEVGSQKYYDGLNDPTDATYLFCKVKEKDGRYTAKLTHSVDPPGRPFRIFLTAVPKRGSDDYSITCRIRGMETSLCDEPPDDDIFYEEDYPDEGMDEDDIPDDDLDYYEEDYPDDEA